MTANLYIAISIIVLLIIVALIFSSGKKQKRMTPIGSLAFSFIIAGIVFGESRFIGYCLIGTGVFLAIIDIIRRSKGG